MFIFKSRQLKGLALILALATGLGVVSAVPARAEGEEVTAQDWANHAQVDAWADAVTSAKIADVSGSRLARSGVFPTGYSVGSILVTVAGGSSSSSTAYDGHAGIAQGSGNRTIEAWPADKSPIGVGGVQRYNISWGAKYSKLRYLTVKGASGAASQKAFDEAATKLGKQFGIGQIKDSWANVFYCSHLVYGAWRRAGYNIDTDTLDAIVTPKEIAASPRTTILFST